MKKIALFGLCVATAVSAFAQSPVLKTAEREVKNNNYDGAMEILKPAMTNPETANQAQTWALAGKAGIDFYDTQWLNLQMKKEVDKKKMANALIDGVNYYLAVLPLDSVADAKGKIKTKYSKEAVKAIKDNYNNLNNAAIFLFEEKDFMGAYDAWGMYLDLPNNPVLGKNAPAAMPDSVQSDIAFNQAISAWQADSLTQSLAAFEKAIALGYNKAQVFDYAINQAAQLRDNEKVYQLAEEAYKRFPNENPIYLQLMINGRIEKGKFDEAASMLDEAIAVAPDNKQLSQLYNVKGTLFDAQKNNDEALKCFEKAVELDQENALAQASMGRALCNQAYAINEEAQNKSNEEYQDIRLNQINPLFKKAAEHLERAIEIDENNTGDAKVYLRNIYYNLGDEANLKRVESM